jgi:hypothetical protein
VEALLFHSIGSQLKGTEAGQLFGKACYKINGKAFVCFFENEMVFKLEGKAHADAIKLSNAKLFDPSGKKRPMKEWVQIPYIHQEQWAFFAKHALQYVKATTK